MSLAALALAMLAARSNSSAANGGGRRGDHRRRRRCRSRTSSTSRARTSTRPTASASSGSTRPASTSERAWRRSWSGCRRRRRFVDGNAPSLPAHAPDHLRAHRRGAGARAGAAVPAGHRLARLPAGARAAPQLPGRRATRPVAWFDNALAERKYNNEIAARYGLVASLLRDRKIPRAKTELAALEKIAPPHPMIEAMAGHVLLERRRRRAAPSRASRPRSRAIRTRCSSSTTIRRRC